MKKNHKTSLNLSESNNVDFRLIDRFYTLEEFKQYIYDLDIHFIGTNKKVSYGNVACVIDIESSSFIDACGNKTAIMYCFTFGINGRSYFGRTYDDLFEVMNYVSARYELDEHKRLIIYVHNLAYEFQFFYKHFAWKSIFALSKRQPAKAITCDGFEFRCSLILSGYSLEKVGEHLQKYPVEKKVGDLDYNLIRHSETPLTSEELNYVLHDGLVVMSYIQEQIESHKNNITRLPLTKTGEVRKYCRDECLYGGGGSHKKSFKQYKIYSSTMYGTRIRSVNEYKQLKRAFAGGFTHANGLIVGNKVKDVTSFDFTSSYPYVMVSEMFPMLSGELTEIHSKDEFYHYLKHYCCLFDVTFYGLESIIDYEHYISRSHCRDLTDFSLDNGRIINAKTLSITITEQDYWIIEKCYQWERMIIKNFRTYIKGYLPSAFVKAILKLYKDKTTLKGVKGMESEYLHSKELINSCFGMCVTDICREEITFDTRYNHWNDDIEEIDYEKCLIKYNTQRNRFLSYAWGIWVTAYARANLWNGIFEFNHDYLYSDTDSIKCIHADDHMNYIETYNKNVITKLERAMKFHKIPMEEVSPKDITGKIHTLGLWDREYHAKYFQTLGAKRYMVEYDDGSHSLTISGLNKKIAIPYLESRGDIFEQFKEYMYIPPNFTGKNVHTYIDEERDGIVKDYLGKWGEYHELSCVHMTGAEYTLSLASDYAEYLLLLRKDEFD